MNRFSAAIPPGVEDEMMRRRQVEDRRRERLAGREERLQNAGLDGVVTDEDFRRIVRNQLDATRSLQLVQGWLQGPSPFLVLLGPAGRGKTVACAWAIAEEAGRYMTAKKLERLFLAQYGAVLEEQDRAMRYRGLLVVDDVGTELKRDEFTSSLYEVVNARQGAGRRTILTTNLSRKEFEARYRDARLLSRLRRAEFAADAGADLREAKP